MHANTITRVSYFDYFEPSATVELESKREFRSLCFSKMRFQSYDESLNYTILLNHPCKELI